ncbi:hypothetical protein DPMN_062403 [Dreissena polymorpha]|uniref:Uncharacterized protein n=1 Tax=Dreissena polymorpha TaxID=45954 RepID=A0A9D4C9K9_DREPO|nr:hypothetical protein DPMN_062403 [Dreissena polymorpha]
MYTRHKSIHSHTHTGGKRVATIPSNENITLNDKQSHFNEKSTFLDKKFTIKYIYNKAFNRKPPENKAHRPRTAITPSIPQRLPRYRPHSTV